MATIEKEEEEKMRRASRSIQGLLTNQRRSSELQPQKKNTLASTLASALSSKLKDEAKKTQLEYLTLEELQDIDITANYQTKQPHNLKTHNQTEVFQKFRQKLIRQKRDLEISILRDNKSHERVEEIIDRSTRYERESQRSIERYDKLQERIKKVI